MIVREGYRALAQTRNWLGSTAKMMVLGDYWELSEPPTIRIHHNSTQGMSGGAYAVRTGLERCVRRISFQTPPLTIIFKLLSSVEITTFHTDQTDQSDQFDQV